MGDWPAWWTAAWRLWVSRLSSTYFRGLNYLLNEQPDKAIELFLHIAELDKETFETQVALGHLFRRRGEVDRAIRLHQGLVQRNDLSDQQRVQALLALGEDYMKSGLLDRAETVFTDLTRIDERAPQALKHLIGIYQAERDWERAIENATRYEEVTGEPMGKVVAQFECELADRHRANGDLDGARVAIARAYHRPTRPACARASWRAASRRMHAIPKARSAPTSAPPRHDPDYLPEFLPSLLACYGEVGDNAGARVFPCGDERALPRYRPGIGADPPDRRAGRGESRARLFGTSTQGPPLGTRRGGVDRPDLAVGADSTATLHDLKHITDQLLVRNPSYRCTRCGFGARTHHWQCPSCKEWGTVKPLLNYAVV